MNNVEPRSSESQNSGTDHSQALAPLNDHFLTSSRLRLVILIAFSIFIYELFVMFIIGLMDPLPVWLNALLAAILLVLLMSPILYFGLFRPLIRHVEEYRRIEKELTRESNVNANLRAVFDAIADPMVLMEKDMTVKIINSSAARYYRLSGARDIFDARCRELLMESAAPCPGCKVPDGTSGGKSVMFERRGLFEKDRLEQVFLCPVDRKDGGSDDILMRISDVTEQRMMERQLIHNEKMASLSVLISSVAHEINNPNNFISFNIPILRDYIGELMPIVDAYAATHPHLEIGNMGYLDFCKDLSNLLDNVEHGSRRISTFISNLKDFSRLTFEVNEDWTDIIQVVKKVAAICGTRLKSDIESFLIDMPATLPRIWSDAGALEQILLNLLTNAIQAVEKKGSKIRLAVDIQDHWIDHIVLTVTDNGSGMDETTLQKAFDPFFTTKPREEGIGLGLYICHHLVERLRGRIEIESRPGKGSIFRVILPDRERRSRKRF